MYRNVAFLITCMLFAVSAALGQTKVSGVVADENNIPLPFVKIFVKNSAEFRTVANIDGVYEMWLLPGEYYLVFHMEGYEERESYLIVNETPVVRNIQLFPMETKELQQVDYYQKKGNKGREIMLNVVKRRDTINPWNYPHTVNVYIRATEKITGKEDDTNQNDNEPDEVSFEPSAEKIASGMNMAEIQLERAYEPPGNVKETRNAVEIHGSPRQLYYTTTAKSNFNFFTNLLYLNDLHQTPVMSPVSGPGILSYKYKLEEEYEENGRFIYKIKIIPRSSSTSTLSGYIYVIDSIWMIQKLELSMNKGNLLVYDYFTIKQSFENQGDTLCVLTEQELDYGVKYKRETSVCKTIANFSDYNFTPAFAKKYFGNEVSVTEKEAYEKDSSFWNLQRQTGLTPEEKQFILVKDSLRDLYNKKEYTDSIDSVFNRITFWKVVWFGIDHRNRVKKTQWTFNSLAGIVRPLYIAGPRLAPGVYFFKKWKDERTLDSYSEISVGLLNNDWKGHTWWKYKYDPFHQGTVTVNFKHDFDVIRSYDAITQIYKRDNFIEVTSASIDYSYEILNGLYVEPTFEFAERRSLQGYKFMNFFDKVIPNDDPSDFQSYQAAKMDITITYTPKQKYMREPYRKVVLGSRFPSFYVMYERGIPRLFGSDIDHEYGRIGMIQTFKIGTLGTSSYHIASGKFLSSKNLKDADFKYMRRSDPIWFSNPLYSFQGLDSSLPSKNYFIEAHFVHHDNGAIINKIPLMKKTRIGLVIGAGALYVKEYNWQHYELLLGLERIIKFNKRRLRIGVYGVVSDGNHIQTTWNYKVSFAVLDNRNLKWNF